MVRLVGLEPTTGKTPVDFKPTAYANFATAAPATRLCENSTGEIKERIWGWGRMGQTRRSLERFVSGEVFV